MKALRLIGLMGLMALRACFAADPIRPDAAKTPGDLMPGVTVERLCTRGYANVIDGGARNVPASLKRAVFVEYLGAVPAHPGDYEVDHLISLELGGSNDIKNLWPESYLTTPWNAHVKDKVEDRMAALVRQELKAHGHDAAAAMLARFQREIANDWIAAYGKYCQ